MSESTFGIYIHIPFCRSRCNYCHFVTRPLEAAVAERYILALNRELEEFFSGRQAGSADTVYFGGGTPSIVPAEHIASALSTCRRLADIAREAEITLEANPGTLTRDKVRAYRSMGVNRISMGAQTFDDGELEAIGRVHTAGQVHETVELLRSEGIANLNLDLMVGLPGQTPRRWTANLEHMKRLEPSHISIYMLDLDSHSPLYHRIAKGELQVPDEDQVADWYLEAIEYFERHGYIQYEISNLARPGFESRHNLKYWLRKPVLGFGVASHSYDGARRYAAKSNLNSYLESIESEGRAIDWEKAVDPDEALGETIFLGLRLREGLDWNALRDVYGTDRLTRYEGVLSEMSEHGLLRRRDSVVQLTSKGMLLSNEVFQRFV
jgi:oxygen-independent coproporphyrinogen-3 oxidase